MLQTRTLAFLAIAVLFVSTHSQLMGGASSQDITPAVRAQAKSMMTTVVARQFGLVPEQFANHKVYETFLSTQLIYYATQVVAGTNHFMVWQESDGEFHCIVLWEKLPSKDGTRALELTSDSRPGLLSDACEKCGAIFNANKEICEAGNKIDL
jgi:hypothetical protein